VEPLQTVAIPLPLTYWWRWEGESVAPKTLLLFFDALGAYLAPEQEDYLLRAATAPEREDFRQFVESGLLRFLRPVTMHDPEAAAMFNRGLGEALDRIDLDALKQTEQDSLRVDVSPARYHLPREEWGLELLELISGSRMGEEALPDVASEMVDRLVAAGVAEAHELRGSYNGRYLDVVPSIRDLIHGLHAEMLRMYAVSDGFALEPVQLTLTGFLDSGPRMIESAAFNDTLLRDTQLTLPKLAGVPIADIVQYRQENGQAYRAYMTDVRRFAREISSQSAAERSSEFAARAADLRDVAADLARHTRLTWSGRAIGASFSVAGIGWAAASGEDTVGPVVAGLGAAIASLWPSGNDPYVGPVRYLFGVNDAFFGRA
jgi:hypothetical protein